MSILVFGILCKITAIPKRTKSEIFPRSCCKSSIASESCIFCSHCLFCPRHCCIIDDTLSESWNRTPKQRRKKQFSDDRKCHETKLSKQREFRIYLLDQSILEIAIANNFLQIVCLDNFFANNISDNFLKIFTFYHFLQILQINQCVPSFLNFSICCSTQLLQIVLVDNF